jgi:hypothetical protein
MVKNLRADLVTRASKILENREKATKYYLSEGLADLLKPGYKGAATIKARRHRYLADKYAHKTDPVGTHRFYHHARGADRYERLAAGKKPFREG